MVAVSGVCGVVSLTGQPVAAQTGEVMAAAAPHRGTGGTAVATAADGVLVQQWRPAGSRQRAGRHPAGDVVVVADARLDNVPELRQALLRSGHLTPAAAPDDHGLLLAAYAAWGEDFASRLLGDFVVVVWDRRSRTLVAARDPMAMRSLYYRVEAGGRLLFGTEAKQVLAAPDVPDDIDEGMVAADLVGDFGRSDRSFFSGVGQLSPGTTLVAAAGGHAVRRFWEVDPARRVDCSSVQEGAEELRRVFVEAVSARLDPAAPTGVLLSGGVDSGSVASVAGWLREQDPGLTPELRSYSWAFETMPECDERHVSRHVVARYGLAATDVPADGLGPLAEWPAHGPDPDDPFLGGFQPLIEHALQLAAADGVGVVLGGDRGDLTIGDTGWGYLRMLQARQWHEMREAVREQRGLGQSWASLAVQDLGGAVGQRLRGRSARQWAAWGAQRARRGQPAGGEPGPPSWLRPSFLAAADLPAARAQQSEPAGLLGARALRHRFVFTPMHVRGMGWSERTYARHGLAFADPFSDRRLVELVLALPQAVLNRPNDQSKPLMREAVRGMMPEAARRGAGKIVPRPLFDSGLRERADLVRRLLTAPLVEQRGWVDAEALRRHFEGWLAGGDLDPEFWWALQVEAWLKVRAADS